MVLLLNSERVDRQISTSQVAVAVLKAGGANRTLAFEKISELIGLNQTESSKLKSSSMA
jgi:hypothetical protein